MPKALSPSDWAAIRAAYETTTDGVAALGKRFGLAHIQISNRAHYDNWLRPAIETSDGEPPMHSLGSFPPSPLMGEGRGGGDLAAESWREVTPTSRGKFDFCEVQKSSRVVLPPQGGGGEKLDGRSKAKVKASPNRLATGTKRTKRLQPKHQGMINRLYRVIDNNLSQLEDIMKNQSDPSIADNEKETRTIGTVIGNIEKLKGLEDDAGKSRAGNKSIGSIADNAETERVGRALAERILRLTTKQGT
jgi:hypothetical protein